MHYERAKDYEYGLAQSWLLACVERWKESMGA
jgi:hypothetical protein